MPASLQIKANAALFRATAQAVSTEATRFYLNGVFVEPAENGGVTMVATDGRLMVVVHDESGEASDSAIIRLSRPALAACKLGRRETGRRVHVDGDEARVYATHKDEPPLIVAASGRCLIDGTFPDWRRVIPPAPDQAEGFVSFAPAAIEGLASIGTALAEALGLPRRSPGVTFFAKDGVNPAIIRWSGIETAFAVLMPLHIPTRVSPIPSFLAASAAMAAA